MNTLIGIMLTVFLGALLTIALCWAVIDVGFFFIDWALKRKQKGNICRQL